jgi:hypothetical protein
MNVVISIDGVSNLVELPDDLFVPEMAERFDDPNATDNGKTANQLIRNAYQEAYRKWAVGQPAWTTE